jgi:hypothetical protein
MTRDFAASAKAVMFSGFVPGVISHPAETMHFPFELLKSETAERNIPSLSPS